MEGVINDPYGEFFIKSDSKFLQSRGRTYWTRSYTLCEDRLPDFLTDLKFVLSCGKAMNLLKYCHHSGKLCSYIMGENQLALTCRLNLNHLAMLKNTCETYYRDVCNDCRSAFKMSNVLTKKDDHPVL